MLFLPLPLLLAFLTVGNVDSENRLKPQAAPEKIGQLPPAIPESSGLELAGNGNLYTHNDAGNAAILFKVSESGKLIQEIAVAGAQNNDWEDLAQDNSENLYIGDVGNNSSKRTRLRIYKTKAGQGSNAAEINFTYEDQKETKGKKKVTNFDCEAMFWHGGHLYLVSKDRGKGKVAKLYQLPDQPGNHQAKLLGSQKLDIMVTSADVSPDGKKVVLIGQGKLLEFAVSGAVSNFINTKPKVHNLGGTGQVEGVVFTDNNTVVFSNEGGMLFRYDL